VVFQTKFGACKVEVSLYSASFLFRPSKPNGLGWTYNCLHHICEIVAQCYNQCSLLGVVGADLVDPGQNKRPCTVLLRAACEQDRTICTTLPVTALGTYADLTEPKNYHAACDIFVQRHLAQENTKEQLFSNISMEQTISETI
jgi:hypothetical protein